MNKSMTDQEKDNLRQYIAENIPQDIVNDPFVVFSKLLEFVVENAFIIGDPNKVQDYFDNKQAVAKQAKIIELEAQLQILPLKIQELQAELDLLKSTP
jgi:hypothetical protein